MDPRDCDPIGEIVERVGGKWTTSILAALGDERMRMKDLHLAIKGISQRMLIVRLRGLERDGLMIRIVHATVPPRKDVVVHWPDGHTTKGIEKHIEDLKYMWTFAPDKRIQEHPARFGTADGEWTAVSGWLEGTFTKPMVLPDGKTVQPTGKAYRIPMATIGHWNKDGIMFEEYLFWDNGEFMKQIGLAQ